MCECILTLLSPPLPLPFKMGCYEISLGDTIGTGSAGSTQRLLDRLLGGRGAVPVERLAVHFHDTYGQVGREEGCLGGEIACAYVCVCV